MTTIQDRIIETRIRILNCVSEEYYDKSHDGCDRYIGCVLTSDTLRKTIDDTISDSIKLVQEETRKETIEMIVDRIEMWADDGVIKTTDDICQRILSITNKDKQK